MAPTTPALLEGIDMHYETENRLVWNVRERRNEERELVYEICWIPEAQHVASLFAGTEEQIRTVADRDVPNLGASSEYHGFSFWNGTQNTLDPIRERCGLCLRSRQPGKLSLRAM